MSPFVRVVGIKARYVERGDESVGQRKDSRKGVEGE